MAPHSSQPSPQPSLQQSLQQSARQALACLDLTSLNEQDCAADIVALCQRATGADQPGRGSVAAVCVWPRRAALARRLLPSHIAVAAVANFPDGGADLRRAVQDTQRIVAAGAQEVDVVFPYRDFAAAPALLRAVRQACAGLRLKVILETGELQEAALITRACRIALNAGADFLKTSTGNTPRSASPEASRWLLQAIAQDHQAAHRVGFKPSGGLRMVADAAAYMALTAELLGPEAVSPQRFRIGASSLLDDIEAVLAGNTARPASTVAANY